jgi:hypothetical protein
MTSRLAKRAAKMTVIPCGPGRFHVYEDPSRVHLLRIPRVGSPVCDCEASDFGKMCAHRLALIWHIDRAAVRAATGA